MPQRQAMMQSVACVCVCMVDIYRHPNEALTTQIAALGAFLLRVFSSVSPPPRTPLLIPTRLNDSDNNRSPPVQVSMEAGRSWRRKVGISSVWHA